MTVAQLIERLKTYDQDTPILLYDNYAECYTSIDHLELVDGVELDNGFHNTLYNYLWRLEYKYGPHWKSPEITSYKKVLILNTND